jgi:alkylation response protein AidB-like acyl-CoA dehydrogenase
LSYALSEEQETLRATVRAFLAERAPPGAMRRAMETEQGWEPGLWKQMVSELGLPGVRLPESVGGSGLGFVELGLVMGELGRALACAPFFSSAVLCAGALRYVAAGSERDAALGAIAAGQTAALALWEPGAGWDLAEVRATASHDGRAFRIRGAKQHVIDGHSAERLLVVARIEGTSAAHGREPCAPRLEGLGLFEVDPESNGVARRPVSTLDPTRRHARIDLDGAAARALGPAGEAGPGLARALDEARIALACEMVGGLESVLEAAVSYARERVQFGRPIGSFQAIKHRCADVQIALEAARTLARCAAAAVDAGSDEVPLLAAAAKARAADAYVAGAWSNIQIHGGIGYTWEHDAHLYYRRAKASAVLLGESSWLRERIALQVSA